MKKLLSLNEEQETYYNVSDVKSPRKDNKSISPYESLTADSSAQPNLYEELTDTHKEKDNTNTGREQNCISSPVSYCRSSQATNISLPVSTQNEETALSAKTNASPNVSRQRCVLIGKILLQTTVVVVLIVVAVIITAVVLSKANNKDNDTNACQSSPCQNKGVCTDSNDPINYTCQCLYGYTGVICETNTDECASAPCLNCSTCMDQINGYLCSCWPGYSGVHCDILQSNIKADLLNVSRGSMPVVLHDCWDVRESLLSAGQPLISGVATVQIGPAGKQLQVYCDMTTAGGGWTVIQRRRDGSVDFYNPWDTYKNGFGSLSTEFWIGNDNLHLITSSKQYVLRFDLTKWYTCESRYAEFDHFSVGDESQLYNLFSVGIYTGNAGNSFSTQQGQSFSTYDRDNDSYAGGSCAMLYHGAWWYAACHSSNLNGRYFLGGNHSSYADGIEWDTWTGQNYSMWYTEMKIRPVMK